MSEDEKRAKEIILEIMGDAIAEIIYIEYSDNPTIQKGGVDFVVILKSGRILLVDDKMRKIITTDLCIEMQQIGKEYYPKKTMADILLYRIPGHRPFFIHTSMIETLFYCNPKWRRQVYRNRKGDGFCAYVPLEEFKKAADHIFGDIESTPNHLYFDNSENLPQLEVHYP